MKITTWIMTGIYSILFIYFLFQQSYYDAFLIISCLGLTVVFFLIYRKYKHYYSPLLFISFTLFVFAGGTLGSVFHFYSKVPNYDDILHFTSGFITGILGYNLVRVMNLNVYRKVTNSFILLFVFTFNMASAAVWELYEFTLDQLFGFTAQRNSLFDTMMDITDAFLATIIALIILYFKLRKRNDTRVT